MKFSSSTVASTVTLVTYLPKLIRANSYSYNPSDPFNPSNWASVTVPNQTNQCDGNLQSGIDIPSSKCNTFDNYTFMPGTCTAADLRFELHPQAVQATYVGDCEYPKMMIPGDDAMWEAIQFHIHAGSDHAIDGNYYSADFHLVHKEVNGSRLAVLGLFLEPNEPQMDPVFDNFLDEWEGVATQTLYNCALNITDDGAAPQGAERRQRQLRVERQLEDTINPYNFLPGNSTTYTYNGSLTTPPCSEIVFWNVVDTPVKLAVSEYVRFANLVLNYVNPDTCQADVITNPDGFTGRPVQPINGRTITRHCPAGYDDSAWAESSSADATGSGTSSASTFSTMSGSLAFFAALSTVVIGSVM